MQFTQTRAYVHVCVSNSDVRVYICAYMLVFICTLGEQRVDSVGFVFLARPGGV